METKNLLRGYECLWEAALGSIGIHLPEESVFRLVRLIEKVNEDGLEKISLMDTTEISDFARSELAYREQETVKKPEQIPLNSPPDTTSDRLFDIRMEEFHPTKKVMKFLNVHGISTIRDLVRKNREEFRQTYTSDRVILTRLDKFLTRLGLEWGMDV